MIAAATARARDSFPESSTARPGRLSRRLAAVAGAAGAAATGGLVGPALTLWQTNFFRVTYQGQNFSQTQFTTNTSGQFGFRFNNAADTYYGWGSLVVDLTGVGQGFRITEAYYNTTPNAAISVGAVPQAVPEPASMALLGLGAAGVAAWRSRKKVPATNGTVVRK